MGMSFDELMAEAKQEAVENGLDFTAKDKTEVLLRPILLLSKQEIKNVMALAKKVGDDKVDIDAQLDAVDQMLVCAADRKDAMKKSVTDLPPKAKMKVMKAWLEAANVPEDSGSTN
jgi:hypothetical protein